MIVSTILLGFVLGQAITMQDKPVVHLQPHRDIVDQSCGGKMLVLIDAPATVQLPVAPPASDGHGNEWVLDVKNLGPTEVTLTGKVLFLVHVKVGQTVHVRANSTGYEIKH